MRLVLLGTGGFIPTESAQTACYFLPEVGVMLDAGTGLYRLPRYLQADELDIYLTHAHGDHTRGMAFLFASYVAHQLQAAPESVNESNIGGMVQHGNHRLHHASRFHATQTAVDFLAKEYEPYQMQWQVLGDSEPLPCGGTLTSFNVGHNDEVGFRLDWPGHSMAYVTDTTAKPDAVYLENIRGVDLLLHDCNGPDRLAGLMERIGHSHTSAVADLAARAGVGRLILVHHNPIAEWSIVPDLERAREIFPATDIGVDGMEVDF